MLAEGSQQSTGSVIESQSKTRFKFTKELEYKNLLGIQSLLNLAIEGGNYFAGLWHKVLQVLFRLEECLAG